LGGNQPIDLDRRFAGALDGNSPSSGLSFVTSIAKWHEFAHADSGTAVPMRISSGVGMAERRLKAWTKPQLKRLGTIKDVAGAQGAGAQGNAAKT
jgi:hypothetical protein